MNIPDPVVSMKLKINEGKESKNLMKGLIRFQREDPTFKYLFNVNNNTRSKPT